MGIREMRFPQRLGWCGGWYGIVWHKMMGGTEQNKIDVMTRNRANGWERLIKTGKEWSELDGWGVRWNELG